MGSKGNVLSLSAKKELVFLKFMKGDASSTVQNPERHGSVQAFVFLAHLVHARLRASPSWVTDEKMKYFVAYILG